MPPNSSRAEWRSGSVVEDTPAVFAQMSRKVEDLSKIGEDSKKSTSNSVNKEANKYILIPVRSKIGSE